MNPHHWPMQAPPGEAQPDQAPAPAPIQAQSERGQAGVHGAQTAVLQVGGRRLVWSKRSA